MVMTYQFFYNSFIPETKDLEEIMGARYKKAEDLFVSNPDQYYISIFNYLQENEISFITLVLLLDSIPEEFKSQIPINKRISLDKTFSYSFKLSSKVEKNILDEDLFKARNGYYFILALFYQLANIGQESTGFGRNRNDFNIVPYMANLNRQTLIRFKEGYPQSLLIATDNQYTLDNEMYTERSEALSEFDTIFGK